MARYGPCANHPETAAKRRCFRCRRPICPACQLHEQGHVFCIGGCAAEHAKEQYLRRVRDKVELDRAYGIGPGARPAPPARSEEAEAPRVVDLSGGGRSVEFVAVLAETALDRSGESPADKPPAKLPAAAEKASEKSAERAPVGERASQPPSRASERTAALPDSPAPAPAARPRGRRISRATEAWIGTAAMALMALTLGWQTVALQRLMLRQERLQRQVAALQQRREDRAASSDAAPILPSAPQPESATADPPAAVGESGRAIARTPPRAAVPGTIAASGPEAEAGDRLSSVLPMEDIARGDDGLPFLALTFDGGADSNVSEAVLDILRAKGIRTTFFLTGQFIEKFPEMTRRIAAEGHEVGNHSYSHPHLTTFAADRRHRTLPGVDRAFLERQLRRTEELFARTTGAKMAPLWRAPYGESNEEILGWARAMGYRHIAWTTDPRGRHSLDSHDWVADPGHRLYKSADEIKRELLEFADGSGGLNGGIILMHLGTQRKIDQAHTMLEEFIDEVRRRGYEFTTVSRLMMAR